MEYRKLGSSDLHVSVIGFGAMGMGGAPFWDNEGDKKSMDSIKEAYDLGINFFDTAPLYGFGHSERLIGKALKPFRDKNCSSCSVYHSYNDRHMRWRGT